MLALKSFLRKLQSQPQSTPVDDDPYADPNDELVNPFTYSEQHSDAQDTADFSGNGFGRASDIDDPELLAAERKEGKVKALFNALPKPSLGQSYNLLAFQAGSFGLRGALIRNTKHNAILGPVAESRNVDFTRAIADVLEQLKAHYKRLPKHAILVTPSVISSMVELPVSPLRPRSDAEMQELIRWELEGTLTQQNKHWLIGSMLVERGYLTASQRDELVEELKVRQSQGGQDGLIRFGDLAVQLKYITHEQLEECFVLQGKLISLDDDLAYGWQAEEPQLNQGLSDEVLLSADEDGNSAHKWLVSGMSKAVRRRWVGAFNLNGLKVEAFYPSVGSSFAALAQRCFDSQQALIEVHQEQLAFISGSQDAVDEIRVEERMLGDIRSDEIHQLLGVLPADLKKLYINFQGAEQEELLFTLEQHTQLEIEPLTLDIPEVFKPEQLSVEALIGLVGAADHFLEHVPKARLSWIPARESEVALWRRLLTPKVIKGVAATLILALMTGFVGWMHWNNWQQSNRLAELEARFEKESALKKQFEQIRHGQIELKTKISVAQAEVAANSLLIASLSENVPRTKNLARVLLKSLSVVTPQGVSLTQLIHKEQQIEILAEAGSDTSGQQFVSSINKVMSPLNYQVVSSDVNFDAEKVLLPYQVRVVLKLKQLPLLAM